MTKSIDVRTPGIQAIAKKWKLSISEVMRLVNDGAKVEKEHTKSLAKARQVARDHIAERPDYYKKLHKMEKSPISMKEETGISGIRGLGNVTGDPALDPVNQYINTNSMSYEDYNGAILRMIRDKHNQHAPLGFTAYDPTDHEASNKPLKESDESTKALVRTVAKKKLKDITGKKKSQALRDKLTRKMNLKELGDFDKTGSEGSEGLSDAPRLPGSGKLAKEAVDVAPMQHMDAAKSGEYRPARASQSRVNLRGSTAHVKGASYQSGTGSARASFSSGAGQMKPTTTNVPFRGMRSVSNAKTTQGAGGSLKPTSTSGSSSFTPNSQSRSMNVGKAMGASKQTSSVVKGMSAAGQEASKKIVPKAASVMATVGKAARALSGPEGMAVTAAAEPLAKKAAASYKAGHQSFKPHGDEGEKASNVFARMKQPEQQKPQGRSVGDYEKQALTPKSYDKPKAENPKVDAPTPPSRPDYFSKGQAFGAARGEAGGGQGKFSYDNKSYQTNVKGEPYKPESQLKQTSIKEETKMDKDLINEALENILEDNLSEMKENLTQALQEKAMEKLEERKKEIAANYFAQ